MIREYLLGLVNSEQNLFQPVCLVLDGPLCLCNENPIGPKLFQLEAYQIALEVPAHQNVINDIVHANTTTVVSVVSFGGVAVLQSLTGPNVFRTMIGKTSIVVSTPVRIVAQDYAKNGSLSTTANIDIEGDVVLMFDLNIIYLYLLQGVLYTDGTTTASTDDRANIEKVFQSERKVMQQNKVSPANKKKFINQLNGQLPKSAKQKKSSNQQRRSYSKIVRDQIRKQYPNVTPEVIQNESSPGFWYKVDSTYPKNQNAPSVSMCNIADDICLSMLRTDQESLIKNIGKCFVLYASSIKTNIVPAPKGNFRIEIKEKFRMEIKGRNSGANQGGQSSNQDRGKTMCKGSQRSSKSSYQSSDKSTSCSGPKGKKLQKALKKIMAIEKRFEENQENTDDVGSKSNQSNNSYTNN